MGFPVGCSELLLIPSFVINIVCFLGFIRRAFCCLLSRMGLSAFVEETERRDSDYCPDLTVQYSCQYRCILGLEQVLPTLKFEGYKETDCAVCLSQLKVGQEITVPKKCGHVFHSECLDPWLQLHQHPTCPLCRTSLSAGCSG